jgi:cap2 methyltransferase
MSSCLCTGRKIKFRKFKKLSGHPNRLVIYKEIYKTTKNMSVPFSDAHLQGAYETKIQFDKFTDNDRILIDSSPREKYRRRAGECKTVLHWGQRKLLMSEIEFFTNHCEANKIAVVVYVGAAPGVHIPILTNMFPQFSFLLYDPAQFMIPKEKQQRLKIKNKLFTDNTAIKLKKKLRKETVYFISDIRSGDIEHHGDEESTPEESEKYDQYVADDMSAQKRWVEILKPHRSIFKFRFPYKPGTTEYFNGTVYLPVWGPQTTTETRLVIEEPTNYRMYDHTKHEEQMFYFNTVKRLTYYVSSVHGNGLDHCFDCLSELHILKEYILMTNPELQSNPQLLNEKSGALSETISLDLWNRTMSERYRFFMKKIAEQQSHKK